MKNTKRTIFGLLIASMVIATAGADQASAGIWDHLNLFRSRRRPSRPIVYPYYHPTYGYYATRWRSFPGSQNNELGFMGGPMSGNDGFGVPAESAAPMPAPPAFKQPMQQPALPAPPPPPSTYEEPKRTGSAPALPTDLLQLPVENKDQAMRPATNAFPPTHNVRFRRISSQVPLPAPPRVVTPAPRSDFGLPTVRPKVTPKPN